MTFDELWREIWKNSELSLDAKVLIPDTISESTKQRLVSSCPDAEAVSLLITNAIQAINNGSTESLDALINKELNNKERI